LPKTFTLSNSEGTATTYGSSVSGEFMKTLVQGQSVREIILFTVPEDAENLTLSYNFGNVSVGPKLANWSLWFP
jgi:hypothetical protein